MACRNTQKRNDYYIVETTSQGGLIAGMGRYITHFPYLGEIPCQFDCTKGVDEETARKRVRSKKAF